MKLAIASGKGGVGKSMVASALAMLFAKRRKISAVDCDVDAPDLHLWLGITDWDKSEKVSVSEKAVIDYDKCIKCGKCAQVCRFGAMGFDKKPEVLPYLCEGCGACEFYCPADAIHLEAVKNGEIRSRKTKYGFPLVSGLLYPGETGSGKIVTELKERADESKPELMILDSAAGIGCPVIASLNGVDYAVLVTEPTPSGFADLQRVLEIVCHFNIPYGLVINKWDINPEQSDGIGKWAGDKLLGKLSFDKEVFKAISTLTPILESESKVADEIKEVAKEVEERVHI